MTDDTPVKQAAGISLEDVKAIAAQMKALPAARDAALLTKRAAIASLSGEIRAMRDKGYTIDQIAIWLRDNTTLIASAATIRSALASKRNRKSKSSARAATKTGGSGAPASAPADRDMPGSARDAVARQPDPPPPMKALSRPRATETEKPQGAGTFAIGSDDV